MIAEECFPVSRSVRPEPEVERLPAVHGLSEYPTLFSPRIDCSSPGAFRRRTPSSAIVYPAPAARPSSAQSAKANRRTRPGATSATTSSGISLPGSSTKAASAIFIPSSNGVNPQALPTA